MLQIYAKAKINVYKNLKNYRSLLKFTFIKMNSKEIEFFASKKISYVNSIAKGGFGEIFLVHSDQYKTTFALKKVPEKRFNAAEIEVMKSIDDVNIVNLYNYYRFDGHVYMLMEYCPTDLYHLIREGEELNEDVLQKYIYNVVKSIKACHDNNIAHNDIKPSNFLVDQYGRIKCCDFGLSNLVNEEDRMINIHRGTLLFMSPEMLRLEAFDPMKADIWALGVTLFYMATKTFPFIASDGKLLLKVILGGGNMPLFTVRNPYLRKLISRCLDVNPENRATIKELIESPYFRSQQKCTPLIASSHITAKLHPIIRPKFQSESKLFMKGISVVNIRRNSPYTSSGVRL